MSIFNRLWRFFKGSNRSGMVHLSGSVLIGSSGAVTSSDTPGFTVTKQTAAGRYRVQVVDSDGSTAVAPAQPCNSAGTAITPWGIQAPNVMVVSAVADNALTTDSALKAGIRNFTPKSGYFDIQLYRDVTSTTSETHTDTNVESGGQLLIGFWAKMSNVTP